jgi:hypothetical protein
MVDIGWHSRFFGIDSCARILDPRFRENQVQNSRIQSLKTSGHVFAKTGSKFSGTGLQTFTNSGRHTNEVIVVSDFTRHMGLGGYGIVSDSNDLYVFVRGP